MSWDFSTDPEFAGKLAWVKDFVRQEIMPLETLALDWHAFREAIQPLSAKVKEQGLWAAHLGPELGGPGYGQVKLALLHEQLGASDLAPPVFGNAAPDSGNSELIAIAGTPQQKRQWLQPLLDGEIFSAFSMTEQGTGSDPRQFTTTAVRDGDGFDICERAVSKSVQGGLLAEQQTIQNWAADSAAAIEAYRLLTLKAAWTIDHRGASAARTEIAMIKYWGAPIMHDVLDQAIQIHGSLGFSTDMPLEQMYRAARASRIYDGPDEVHRATVARRTLRDYQPHEIPSEHIPTRRREARAFSSHDVD